MAPLPALFDLSSLSATLFNSTRIPAAGYEPASPSQSAVWTVMAVFAFFILCFIGCISWIRCADLLSPPTSPSSSPYDNDFNYYFNYNGLGDAEYSRGRRKDRADGKSFGEWQQKRGQRKWIVPTLPEVESEWWRVNANPKFKIKGKAGRAEKRPLLDGSASDGEEDGSRFYQTFPRTIPKKNKDPQPSNSDAQRCSPTQRAEVRRDQLGLKRSFTVPGKVRKQWMRRQMLRRAQSAGVGLVDMADLKGSAGRRNWAAAGLAAKRRSLDVVFEEPRSLDGV